MDDSPQKGISRRQFLKGMGTGILGSYVLLPGMKALAREKPPRFAEITAGKELVTLTVNGKKVSVYVKPSTTLLQVIRDYLQLTGTKSICNRGECGGCTVLLNGKAVYSCHMLALDAADKEVLTIEGLLKGEELHPLQKAFWEQDGLQCGFCTPGQIMAAYALLQKNPQPSVEEIKEGLAGNLCRCAAYPKIIKSVQFAARQMKATG